MEDQAESHRNYVECLRIYCGEGYSKELSAQLIEWLRTGDAAVADLAGKSLIKFGSPAFEDLLAVVNVSGPWTSAIWVLTDLSCSTDRLLPLLRIWILHSDVEIERQSAVSLAGTIKERKCLGHAPDALDIAACRQVFERYAGQSASMKLQLRLFREWLITV